MNIKQYLHRIEYYDEPIINQQTLAQLHEHHILHVPFEDLNIHYGIPIELEIAKLFDKIVLRRRGGFCYELNYLFNTLLQQLGFQSIIISAKTFDSEGQLGPSFDHMCIVVALENQLWLADVGFGDLFLQPIVIQSDSIQSDSRNYFKIIPAEEEWLLLMSIDNIHFKKKYIFNLKEQSPENFKLACYDKQHQPDSHFVKNKICTKATPEGRITIFNDKLIITKNGKKSELFISDEKHLLKIIKEEFGIQMH